MATQKRPQFGDVERVMREIILPFYMIERAIPLPFVEPRRWENDAEHSWSTALIACMLAPHIDPSLDVGKVSQFAIVHDIVEVYAGDTNVFGSEDDHQTKEEREHQGLKRLAKEFAHFPWLVETIQEYEKQEAAEALYVRSIDKYLALIFDYVDEGRYYKEKGVTKNRFIELMKRPRAKARGHKGAFDYHEEALNILLSHPEFFAPDDKKQFRV